MKLLIITQVIDTEHPILGFFHRWVQEFAKHCEHVHVICLEAGKHSLPANVTVHSLGKEKGVGKFGYLFNFYKLIWKLRHEYDNVFVHMNQIYVILGAPFWRALNKKVGLWYAHGTVTNSLRMAVLFSHKVFTSTEEGMRIKTQKREIVGQGIDTDIFKQGLKPASEILRLITVGRLSQSKNIETLLKACAKLKIDSIPFHFNIIGPAITQSEEMYALKVKKLSLELGLEDFVTWVGSVPHSLLPDYLQESDIFIHDGSTNSLDKTLIEASLCGCLVISSNPAYKSVTGELAPKYLFSQGNSEELAKIIKITSDDRRIDLVREMFLKKFSVQNLISGIINKY